MPSARLPRSAAPEPLAALAWSLVVFFGTATTLYGYSFLSMQHLDQFPPLFRAMDPGYLPHDFFTEHATAFTERQGYIHLLTALMPPFTHEALFFTLTWLANVGIGGATYLAGRDFFRSRRAGLVGAALVLTMQTFKLGYMASVYQLSLAPSHLVMPLILLALWQGLRQRPVATAWWCGLAALAHPLVGPGVAGLLLLQQLIVLAWEGVRDVRRYALIVGSGLFVLACAALHVVPYLQQPTGSLDDALFFEVFLFRYPHHYVPTHFFSLRETVDTLAFLAASVLAWTAWRRLHPHQQATARGMGVLTVLLVGLCVLGYLLVEVWPVRLLLTIQTFRFLFVVRWLGLLLVGGVVAAGWDAARRDGTLPAWLAALLLPVTTLVALMLRRSTPLPGVPAAWHARLRRALPMTLTIGLLGAGMVALGWLRSLWIPWALFAVLLYLAFHESPRRAFAGLAAAVVLVAALVAVPRTTLPQPVARVLGHAFQPQWGLSDYPAGPAFALDAYVAAHLPETSLLVVPPVPELALLRISARRALVVDLYAVPLGDAAMAAWRDRILALYTPPGTTTLPPVQQLPTFYRRLAPERLAAVGARYGATHAVLYADTPTDLPVLYRNARYQLVALPTP